MPGYGITPSGDSEGVLPWSWAVERLTKAHNYWVATGGSGAAPQLTAVWGVWLDGAFYFSCSENSRKARKLAEDPRRAISTERADEAVIVEGVAELVADHALLEQFKAAYVPNTTGRSRSIRVALSSCGSQWRSHSSSTRTSSSQPLRAGRLRSAACQSLPGLRNIDHNPVAWLSVSIGLRYGVNNANRYP